MKLKKLLSVILAVLMFIPVGTISASADDLPFTDVAKDWAYEPIKFVYENGLMNGTGGTDFSPKAPLTRAMVVTVLYRLAGSPASYFSEGEFMDVKRNLFYTEAAMWGLKNGVITGTHTDEWGTPYLSPDRNITRQELATLFVRFAKYQKVILSENGDISRFTDADKVASWAEDAMKWATDEGLINGTGNGKTLSPTGEATREQFAAIIQRYCTAEFDHEVYYAEPENGNGYKKPVYELCTDADVYVAVDGNDNNPGTLDKPLATLEGARNKVRQLMKTAKDEIVVAFMAGEYESPDNLTFTAEDTGTADVPITYRAYGDGDVIFNGGFTVKANEFTAITDTEAQMFSEDAAPYIKKADISDRLPEDITYHNYLFSEFNGTMCWQARDVNMDLSGSNHYYLNQTTRADGYALKLQNALPSKVEKFSSYDGLWVKGQLCAGYTFEVFKVLSYDSENQLLYLDKDGYECLQIDHDEPHFSGTPGLAAETRFPDKIFFFNLPEFLDGNGEYWIDEDTGILYVYDPAGDYSYSMSGRFMTFEEGCDYYSFIGLQFRGAAYDKMIYISGDHFTFDGCRLGSFSSIYGIFAKGSNNFTLENCEVYAFPSVGVGVISDADRNNVISANNVFRNNYFHDFGNPEYWSEGIEIINDVGALVEHNEFKDAAHGGVEFKDCIDTVIQYNVFDHLMHSTSDYGAVYTHRGCAYRDNIIRYNLFKNFTNFDQGYCFYNDGSYGQHFYGNILYMFNSSGYVCNDGRDNTIYDNIVIDPQYINAVISYNPGPYKIFEDSGKQGDIDGLLRHLDKMVKPGEEGYDTWYSRWEVMYKYDYSLESVGDFYSFYSTINYVKRNKIFDGDKEYVPSFGAVADKFAVLEDNIVYPETVNPYFKCPATGDYTIVSNADDFENIYDFSKIGIIN